jgi:hypothetical protein
MMGKDRQFARIGVALVSALALSAVLAGENALFRVRPIAKGSRAAYTMRAPFDLVWNQNELRAEVVRGFIPIYDETPGLLEARRRALASEVEKLQPSYWGPVREPADLGASAGSEGANTLAAADPALARAPEASARVAEAQGLVSELFDLVAQLYRDGVIADAEFPAQRSEIRVFTSDHPGEAEEVPVGHAPMRPGDPTAPIYGGKYRRVPVARLHRFSELRPLCEHALERYYPAIEPKVRAQVVTYLLDRLPPNLRYSRTNADNVADRSLVTGQKAVLLHAGEILVRRGRVVDTRVEDALRAAQDAMPSGRGAFLASLGMLLAVTLLGGQMMAASAPTTARPGVQAMLLFGLGALAAAGKLMLALGGAAQTAVPMAAVAGAVALRSGARPAVAVALIGAAYAALALAFDVTTFAITLGGGLTLALVAKRGRLRSGILAAVAAALVQGVLWLACAYASGRGRSPETVLAGLQSMAAGVAAGLLALCAALVWRLVRTPSSGAVDGAPALDRATAHATIPAKG